MQRIKTSSIIALMVLVLSVLLAGCGSSGASGNADSGGAATVTTGAGTTGGNAGSGGAATATPAGTAVSSAAGANAGGAADPAAALKQLETKVYSTGPNGEQPSSAADVKLSDDELAKVKGMNATAAIVLHYAGNDWSTAQVDGLKSQFAKLGINVIAVTDANFKPEKQVSDLETVLAKKPSIIVSIPTDPVATADAYKKAAAAGVKLVFMDNVPKGMQQGKDYVSVVSADNYGNGVAAGHLMAQALNSKGKIGLIYHAADFFVTKQRYEAFKKTIQDNYKDIQIVAEQGIAGPDFAGDAEKAAGAMLTKHPDLNGIWAVWDVPAEGVMAAVRSSGRTDVAVTTCDLGKNVAIEMAKGGIIKGLGAQRPFDQGVTEANLGAYALLGKQAPAYVALNALPVTKANVLDAWQTVYHQDPPADLKAAAGK
jgi:ribose transport system substrate-binding protein